MSRPPAGFSTLAVLRGLQLTVLGSFRALQNPYLSKSGYYRRAGVAIAISIVIQILIWLPIWLLRLAVWALMFVASEASIIHLRRAIDTCAFIENNVLNIGFFLISAMRYFRPEMDDIFLMSLQYVDCVYKKHHPESTKQYYGPLRNYTGLEPAKELKEKESLWLQIKNVFRADRPFRRFLSHYMRRSTFALAVYFISSAPGIGPFVLPIIAFYNFNQVVGTPVAVAIFAVGLAVKTQYMVMFLSTFWGGRSLVRELLSPYFARVPFSRSDKDHWFKAREGILFGFGCGFFWMMKIPFLGVFVYGIAQASTAYLISKVSEPPPAPGPQLSKWVENEVIWTTQNTFLSGVTLNDDGFGPVIPIVPSNW